MAGQLIQVATETVTSAVGSVQFISKITTDDVYMVAMNNILPVTDNVELRARFSSSGTGDATANYDTAKKQMRADSAFGNISSTNQTEMGIVTLGTAGNEMCNGILYLYNVNNSSEYSFVTIETSNRNTAGHLRGDAGGYVHTVSSSFDGINFFMSSGNIASGTFTLFKVV